MAHFRSTCMRDASGRQTCAAVGLVRPTTCYWSAHWSAVWRTRRDRPYGVMTWDRFCGGATTSIRWTGWQRKLATTWKVNNGHDSVPFYQTVFFDYFSVL
ncbi:hypothetical protein Trydic_g23693 [Trypoxylus dichotomus]